MPVKTSQVTDKNDEPIHVGDVVSAKARGGKHVGEVTDIVMTTEEAGRIEGISVKNPPKVIFKDQHGKARMPWTEIEQTDDSGQAIQYLIIHRHSCMAMILGSNYEIVLWRVRRRGTYCGSGGPFNLISSE
jgi:sporulation protein YlmC with PRC-barrel domain